MKTLVVSFVSAAALAAAGMAVADNSTVAYDNNSGSNAAGIFISGNLGYGSIGVKKSDFNDPITGTAPTKFNNTGLAWAANLGYQFNQYVAVEAGYLDFGGDKATGTISGNPVTQKDTFGGFNIAVKGILPINRQFDLFGKAGLIDMHWHETDSSSTSLLNGAGSTNKLVPLLGIGAAYNINSNVALTLQDVYSFKSKFHKDGNPVTMPSANAILTGVSYKFNV